MSSEAFAEIAQVIIKAIPQTVDKDHREKIKSSITYANEYSLRKRVKHILTQVLKPYEDFLKPLLGEDKEFIGQFVDTRNYLTHYTISDKQKPVTDGMELYSLTNKVKLLVELCFLVELGLPADVAKKVISRRKF